MTNGFGILNSSIYPFALTNQCERMFNFVGVVDSTLFCVRMKNRVAENTALASNSCWCMTFVPNSEAG